MTLLEFARKVACGPVPLAVFVDLQVEYAAEGRAYSLQNLETCLGNCRTILSECRKVRLPIVHFRLLRSNAFFNTASRFSEWIEEFRPRPNEMIFEHGLPSCYSNREFCAFLDTIDAPTMILTGLTGERACLSTAIDAYHRNHTAVFVADASASQALPGLDSVESHTAITRILSLYAEVVSTRDVLHRIASINPVV
jgi:nicotinamidase-related amidase